MLNPRSKLMRPLYARLHYAALFAVLVLVVISVAAVVREGARISALIQGGSITGVAYDYRVFSAPGGEDPEAALAQEFRPIPLMASRAPFAHHTQWHLLTLRNTTAEARSLALLVDNPLIDLAHIYRVADEGTPVLVGALGGEVPGLSMQERATPHFLFSLPPLAEKRLLIGHFTNGSPLFPLTVLTESDFADFQIFSNQIWAGFIAISLLICLYNFMLYLAIGDRTYLVYISYVISMLFSFGASSGYIHFLLAPELAVMLSEQIVFLNALSMILAIQFAVYFLRLDEDNAVRFYLAQGFSVIAALMAMVSLFVSEYLSGPAFTGLHAISYLLAVALFSYRFRQRLSWTRFYLVSWVPFLIGVGFVSGLFQGTVPYGLWARFAGIAGVSLEMALMSMALADRLIRHERLRLHQATHDPVLGLGSYDVMASALADAWRRTTGLRRAIVHMEVSNYHQLVPYLSAQQFRSVMCGLASLFEQRLAAYLRVIKVDRENSAQPCVVLSKSELFSAVVEESQPGRLREALTELGEVAHFNPCPGEVPYRVHCRFGAAFFEQPVPTVLATFNHGLVALDLARQQGVPLWLFSQQDMESADRRIRLARDLDTSIRNDSLKLYYQPKLDMQNPGTHLAEALLRWEHPELGWIAPDEIIAIAENTGLIQPLTRWVLSSAISTMHAVQASWSSGGAADTGIHVSVNVSTHDLSDAGFADYIEALLEQYPLPPGYLTLEVTESARLTDSSIFAANLERVRALGVRCAVDDFGTGYAALSYATAYPFDELKIDRSFTSQMSSESRFRTAIRATVVMASRLGMLVTAEGVETLEDAQALAALDCRYLQGYWISRPMDWASYLSWVEQGSELPLVHMAQQGGA